MQSTTIVNRYFDRVIALLLVIGLLLTGIPIGAIAQESVAPTVVVTVEPSVGGNATGTGVYAEGDTVVASASPSVGYAFAGWKTEAGETVSTEAEYSFAYSEPTRLIASFSLVTYHISLTSSPGEGGTVTGGGIVGAQVEFDSAYDEDTPVVALATPNEGYRFAGWYEGSKRVYTDVDAMDDPTYEFAALADRNLRAEFVQANPGETFYSISADVAPKDSGSVTGAGSYKSGDPVTLSATPAEGYTFERWEDGSTQSERSFSATANLSAVAYFKAIDYTINTAVETQGGPEGQVGGTATAKPESVAMGEEVRLQARPAADYSFVNWTDEEGTVVSDSTEYLLIAHKTQTYTAHFARNACSITASSANTAAGFVRGGGEVAYGESATVQAYARTGFVFTGWYDGLALVSEDAEYSFEATDDRSLVAHFSSLRLESSRSAKKIVEVVVHLDISGQGSARINDVLVFDSATGFTPDAVTFHAYAGQSMVLSAEGSADLPFSGWFCDGQSTAGDLKFTPSKDQELTATFGTPNASCVSVTSKKPDYYKVNGGGVIAAGESTWLSIEPVFSDAWLYYEFDGWYDASTGRYLSDQTNYRYEPTKTTSNIEARFVGRNYQVAMASSQNINYMTSGVGDYRFGQEAYIELWWINNYIYQFDGWTVNENYTHYEPWQNADLSMGNFSIRPLPLSIDKELIDRLARDEGYNRELLESGYIIIVAMLEDENSSVRTHKVSLTVKNTSYGTASGAGEYFETLDNGGYATIKATPKADGVFLYWTAGTADTGEIVSYDDTYTFDFTTNSEFSFKAHFASSDNAASFTLAGLDDSGWSFTMGDLKVSDGACGASKGARTTLKAVSGAGTFAGWYTLDERGNRVLLETSRDYTFDPADLDGKTVYPLVLASSATNSVFLAQTFAGEAIGEDRALVTAKKNGRLVTPFDGVIEKGATYTFEAYAIDPYLVFEGWYLDGTLVSAQRIYQMYYSSEKTARTLEARYKANDDESDFARLSIVCEGNGNAVAQGDNRRISNGKYYFPKNTAVRIYTQSAENSRVKAMYLTDPAGNTSELAGETALETLSAAGDWTLRVVFESKVSVVAQADPAGQGTVSGGGLYWIGDTAELVATPEEDYELDGWYRGSSKVGDGNALSVTVTGNAAQDTYTARFRPGYQWLAVSTSGDDGRGSVEVLRGYQERDGDRYAYIKGDVARVEATAAAGYRIDSWDIEGAVSRIPANVHQDTQTYVMNDDTSVCVNFSEDMRQLKLVAADGHGTVFGDNGTSGSVAQLTVKNGAPAYVSVVANTGYRFVNWTDERGRVVLDVPCGYYTVTTDETLTANFEPVHYVVSSYVDPCGAGTVRGAGTYEAFSYATLTAEAADGYEFAGWTLGEETDYVSTDPTFRFEVTDDLHVTAHFTERLYWVNVICSPPGFGYVSIWHDDNSTCFHLGETVNLEAHACQDCEFVGWFDGETCVWASASYDFVVEGDTELTARFAQIGEPGTKYSVDVCSTPSTGGQTYVQTAVDSRKTSSKQVADDAWASVSAIPAQGYSFVEWRGDDGMHVSASDCYTFKINGKNVSLAAVFRADRYQISVEADPQEGGSATVGDAGATTLVADYGTTTTLVAIPEEGWHFTGWLSDGKLVSIESSHEVTVKKDAAYTATFARDLYTIATVATGPGSISGAGVYQSGDNVELVATPDEHAHLVGWYADATLLSTDLKLSFVATESACYMAKFVADQVTVDVGATPQEGGTAAIRLAEGDDAGQTASSMSQTVDYGTLVTLEATPFEHYDFAGWKKGEEADYSSTEQSFTIAAQETASYTAYFEKEKIAVSAEIIAAEGAADGVTVLPSGDASYAYGTEVTFSWTGSLAEGVDFMGWIINGENEGQGAGETHALAYEVTAETHAYAVFHQGHRLVVARADMTNAARGSAKLGAVEDVVEISVTPDVHYHVDKWVNAESEEIATEVEDKTKIRVTVADTPVIQLYTAKMLPNSYAISTYATTGGTVSASQNADFGSEVTVSAMPDDGWRFAGWFDGDNVQKSSRAAYTFTVAGDVSLTARFVQESYDVSLYADPAQGGEARVISGSGQNLHYGDTVTVGAYPEEGYAFEGWFDAADGQLLAHDTKMVLTITQSRAIKARFYSQENTVRALAVPSEDGTVAINGGEAGVDVSATLQHGDLVTVSAQPAEHHVFSAWTDADGNEVSSHSDYTWASDVSKTLTANFVPESGTLVAAPRSAIGGSAMGAVAIDDVTGEAAAAVSATVSYGQEVTLTASPIDGARFAGWYLDSMLVSKDESYTFNVRAFGQIDACFANDPVYVNARSARPLKGSVSGGGVYERGTDATLAATAREAAHSQFNGWYDGQKQAVSAENPYTIPNVQSDVNLYADFALQQCSVTTAVSPTVGGTVTGGGTYVYGETANLVATPAEGYDFVDWRDGGGVVVSTNPAAAVTVTGDATYTANFVQKTYTFTLHTDAAVLAAAGGSFAVAALEGTGTVTPKEETLTYTVTHGTRLVLTASVPTTEGYVFENYRSIAADGAETILTYDATFTTEAISSNTDLYANYVQSYDVATTLVAEWTDPLGRELLPGVTPQVMEQRQNTTEFKTESEISYGDIDANLRFVGWYDEAGLLLSNDPSFAYTALQPQSLTAKLELKDVALLVKTPDPPSGWPADTYMGGTLSASAYRDAGESLSVYATAGMGYGFDGWQVDEGEYYLTCDAGYDYRVPSDASAGSQTTLTGWFIPINYMLTLKAEPVEGGSVGVAGAYPFGTQVQIGAGNYKDYEFVHWKDASGNVISTEPSPIVTITGDATYTAEFKYHEGFDAAEAVEIGIAVLGAVAVTAGIGVLFYEAGVLFGGGGTAAAGTAVATDVLSALSSAVETIADMAGGKGRPKHPDNPDNPNNPNNPDKDPDKPDKDPDDDPDADLTRISALVEPVSSGTVTGEGQYREGKTAELVAVASTGYEFVKWTRDGVVVDTTAAHRVLVGKTAETYTAHFTQDDGKTTITTMSDPVGVGTTTGDGRYDPEDSFIVSAREPEAVSDEEGYVFSHWTRSGDAAWRSEVASTTIARAGEQAETFTAHFDSLADNVRIVTQTDVVGATEAEVGGTATVQGGSSQKRGSAVTLTATPASGYVFSHWTCENDVAFHRDEATMSVTATTNAQVKQETYTAHFLRRSYTVTASVTPEGKGTIAPATTQTMQLGDTQVYTVTPDVGFEVSGWDVNGVPQASTEETFTYKAGGNDETVAIKAVLQAKNYSIVVRTNAAAEPGGGTADITGVSADNRYAFGDVLTLTANPAEGYEFQKWTHKTDEAGVETDVANGTNAVYHYTVESHDDILIANFVRGTYEIKVDANPERGGSITATVGGIAAAAGVDGKIEAIGGQEVVLTAVANEHYSIENWYMDGIPLYVDPAGAAPSDPVPDHHSFTATKNCTVTAKFTSDQAHVKLECDPDAGGAITAVGYVADALGYIDVPKGTPVKITVLPADGYEVTQFEKNHPAGSIIPKQVDDENSCTLTPDADDDELVVTARMAKTSTVITARAVPDEGGNVNEAKTVAKPGSEVTLRATPAEGGTYAFDGWYDEANIKVCETETYVFNAPEADATFTARFKHKDVTITVDADPETAGEVRALAEGGADTDVSDRVVTAPYGTDVTVTAVPSKLGDADDTYQFLGWYTGVGEAAVRVSSLENYTFAARDDEKLTARFAEDACRITLTAEPEIGGTVKVLGDIDGHATVIENVEANKPMTVMAEAKDGYYFDGWYEAAADGGAVVDFGIKRSDDSSYTFTPADDERLVAKFVAGAKKLTLFDIGTAEGVNATTEVLIDGVVKPLGADKSINLKAGTRVTVRTQVPEAHRADYDFLGWFANDGDAEAESLLQEYSFEIVDDTRLTAKYQKNIVDITVHEDPDYGGAAGYETVPLDIDPVLNRYSYRAGTEVTLKAVANPGYIFHCWRDETGRTVGAHEQYTFTARQDKTLVALFREENKVRIYIEADSPKWGEIKQLHVNGAPYAIGADGYIEVNKGSTIWIEAEEKTDALHKNEFEGWYKDGKKVGKQETYSFTAEEDCRVIAAFGHAGVLVLDFWTPFEGGTVQRVIDWVQIGEKGREEIRADVYLTAQPNVGYEFDGWYDLLGIKVHDEKEYEFKALYPRILIAHFIKVEHAVSCTVSPQAGGSVVGTGSYPYGDMATLLATSEEGYVFEGFYGQDGHLVSTEPSYAFPVREDTSYSARFKQQNYTLSAIVNDETLGTVAGAGTYGAGVTVQLQAMPLVAPDGSMAASFVGWFGEGGCVSTDENYSFVLRDDCELYAVFARDEVTVSLRANPTVGGTVSGEGGFAFERTVVDTPTGETTDDGQDVYEETITVASEMTLVANATPNPGYSFEGWYGTDGTLTSAEAQYSFTVPSNASYDASGNPVVPRQHITLEARFVPKEYQVTATSANVEEGTVSGGGTYVTGQTASVHATPAATKAFSGWYAQVSGTDKDGVAYTDEVLVSPEADFEFVVGEETVPGGELALTARFIDADMVRISAIAAPIPLLCGRAKGPAAVRKGETASYTALPSFGYEFVNWTDADGTVLGTEATLEVATTTDTSDMTIYANFEVGEYVKVKVTSNSYLRGVAVLANAVVKVDGVMSMEMPAQRLAVVTAIPFGKNTFKHWINQNGVKVSNSKTYAFWVTENTTLTAVFEKEGNEIRVVKSPPLRGFVFGQGHYATGEKAKLVAVPFPDFYLAWWLDEHGRIKAPLTPVYRPTVIGSQTYTAVFKQITHQVTAEAYPAEGGNVSGDTGLQVKNFDATLVAAPNTGYQFDGWYVGEELKSTDATWTFKVTERTQAVAHFIPARYTLDVSVGGNGGIAPAGKTEIAYGASQEITATPDDNYYVSVLTDNETSVLPVEYTGGATTYALSDVAADHIVYAEFDTAYTPSFTKSPTSASIRTGSSHTLMAAATVADGGALSYQWYKDGAAISGATTEQYQITSASAIDEGVYWCETTNTKLGTTMSARSGLAQISVHDAEQTQAPSPTSPLVRGATAHTAVLAWSYAEGIDSTSFVVEYRPVGTADAYSSREGITGTGCVVTGLSDGVTYEWRVRARQDGKIDSASVSGDSFTTLCIVRFDSRDGNKVLPREVAQNAALGDRMPSEPTREGYTFAGWVCDDGITPFIEDTIVADSLVVNARWKPDAPFGLSIDYANETLVGVSAAMEYRNAASTVYTAVTGDTVPLASLLSTTVYVRVMAAGIDPASDDSALVVPARPAPPSATVLDTTSTSVTLRTLDGAQYRLLPEGAWQDSPVFEGLTSDTMYEFAIRYPATEMAFASAEGTVSAQTAPTVVPEPSSFASISYLNETASLDNEGYEYSFDNVTFTPSAMGEAISLEGHIVEYGQTPQTLYVRQTGAATGTPVQEVTIPARPAGPTLLTSMVTDTSIVMQPVAKTRFSLDGSTWQTTTTFEGLNASTNYVVSGQRSATLVTFKSSISTLDVTTMNAQPDVPDAGKVRINYDTETATVDESLEYSFDGVAYVNSDGSPISLELVIGDEDVTLYARIPKTSDTPAGKVLEKKIPARRGAPTVQVKSVTESSVELVSVPGAEYVLDTASWQDSPTFDGLESATAYTALVRLKATAKDFVSETAQGSTATSCIVSGTVADADGNPLADVKLAEGVTTNDDGTYRTVVEYGGDFELRPQKTGYAFSPAETVYETLEEDATSRFMSVAIPISLAGGTLAPAQFGVAYTAKIDAATGGSGNYTYEARDVPDGLQFDSGALEFSGTLQTSGSFVICVTATDTGNSQTATASFFLTVGKADLSDSILIEGTKQTYDGNPRSVQVEGIPDDVAYTVEYVGIDGTDYARSSTPPDEVGTYRVYVTVDEGENYMGSAKATLVIAPATATFTFTNTDFTYDGNAKSPEINVSPSGVSYKKTYEGTGDTVYAASADAPTQAGSYRVSTEVTDSCYTGKDTADFTIGKATPDISITNTNFTYDKTAKAVTVSTDPTGLPCDVSYTQRGVEVEPVDAGTYQVAVTVENENYAGSASAVLTIGKAPQSITDVTSYAKTFGDNAFALDNDAKTQVFYQQLTGQDVVSVDATGMVNIRAAGTAQIRATAPGDNNYEAAASVTIEIAVAPSGEAKIAVVDVKETYKGTPVTPSVSTQGATTWQISYEGTGETSYPSTNLPPTDAGTYRATAVTTDANFTPKTAQAEIVIEKAALAIKAQDARRLYGEANPSFEITSSGFVNGEDMSALSMTPMPSCTATRDSVPGDYPITLSAASAENYEIVLREGTLSVVQDQPDETYFTVQGEEGTGGCYVSEEVLIQPTGIDGYDLVWDGLQWTKSLKITQSGTYNLYLRFGKSTTGAQTADLLHAVVLHNDPIEVASLAPASGIERLDPLNPRLVVTYAEQVEKGDGNISVYDSHDNLVEAVPVGANRVRIVEGNKLTLRLSRPLEPLASYRVEVDGGIVKNQYGRASEVLSDWSFETAPQSDIVRILGIDVTTDATEDTLSAVESAAREDEYGIVVAPRQFGGPVTVEIAPRIAGIVASSEISLALQSVKKVNEWQGSDSQVIVDGMTATLQGNVQSAVFKVVAGSETALLTVVKSGEGKAIVVVADDLDIDVLAPNLISVLAFEALEDGLLGADTITVAKLMVDHARDFDAQELAVFANSDEHMVHYDISIMISYLRKGADIELGSVPVTTTQRPLLIGIELTQEMIDADYVRLVRTHGGIAETLPSQRANGYLWFSSDLFSTFTVVYGNNPIPPTPGPDPDPGPTPGPRPDPSPSPSPSPVTPGKRDQSNGGSSSAESAQTTSGQNAISESDKLKPNQLPTDSNSTPPMIAMKDDTPLNLTWLLMVFAAVAATAAALLLVVAIVRRRRRNRK